MEVHAVIASADLLDDVVAEMRAAAANAGICHSTIEAETKACPDCSLIAKS